MKSFLFIQEKEIIKFKECRALAQPWDMLKEKKKNNIN